MAEFELTIYDNLLGQIEDGSKPLDIRVGRPKILKIRTGDRIRFCSCSRSCWVRVTGVRHYRTFVDMLETEDLRKIAPSDVTKKQVLGFLYERFDSYLESLGVYVIEFQKE